MGNINNKMRIKNTPVFTPPDWSSGFSTAAQMTQQAQNHSFAQTLSRPPLTPPNAVTATATIGVAPTRNTTPAASNSNLISMATHGGVSSLDVKEVQATLNRLDVRDMNGNKLAVDGFFGPLTDSAVRNFQTSAGITVDGIVGPQTAMEFRGRGANFVGPNGMYAINSPYRQTSTTMMSGVDSERVATVRPGLAERQAHTDTVLQRRAERIKAQEAINVEAWENMVRQSLTPRGRNVFDRRAELNIADTNQALLVVNILEANRRRPPERDTTRRELEAMGLSPSHAALIHLVFSSGMSLGGLESMHQQQRGAQQMNFAGNALKQFAPSNVQAAMDYVDFLKLFNPDK